MRARFVKRCGFLVPGVVCAGTLVRAQSPGSFTPAGTMTTPRAHHTATLLKDGRVLVKCGIPAARMGVDYLDNAELYDPATHACTATGKMTTYG